MVDSDIILAKASAVEKHLRRIEEKSQIPLPEFLNNSDLQDVILFNIQMAVQNCIDIAAHLASSEGFGVPGSNNELFYTLEEHAIINPQLTERLVKAVGFRNLIVHEYARLELDRVFHIARKEIHDLHDFIKTILVHYNLTE
jgi:uncharacterized protein YutE (UPF0331/DUF86 family)